MQTDIVSQVMRRLAAVPAALSAACPRPGMQLRADQLGSHLKKAGEQGLRRSTPSGATSRCWCRRRPTRSAPPRGRPGYGERQVHTVAGAHFNWSGVLGAAQSMSLFSERQLVEIRIPSGKPGKDGSEALQRYCAPAEPRRADPGAVAASGPPAATKCLVRRARCRRPEHPRRPRRAGRVPAWIAQRLARQGQRVQTGEEGERALACFADRVEGNLLAAHQEIQKLGLLHPPGELSGRG
jgi:DNA polymerase III subunit delta